MKVVLLSKIYIGTFVNQKQLKKIIERINQLKSDYIVISSDTFDKEAFECCNISLIVDELNKLKIAKGVLSYSETILQLSPIAECLYFF